MITVQRMVLDTDALRRLYTELGTPDEGVEMMAQTLVADIGEHWSAGISAPGEAPGVDTGALKNSIRARRIRAAVWAVMDGVGYGLDLEVGRLETKLAARPWMVPAVERVVSSMPGVFREVIEDVL